MGEVCHWAVTMDRAARPNLSTDATQSPALIWSIRLRDPSAMETMVSGQTQKPHAYWHLRVQAASIVMGAIFSPRCHASIRSRYHPTLDPSSW